MLMTGARTCATWPASAAVPVADDHLLLATHGSKHQRGAAHTVLGVGVHTLGQEDLDAALVAITARPAELYLQIVHNKTEEEKETTKKATKNGGGNYY